MATINYKEMLAGLGERGMTVPEFAVFLALVGVRFASKTRLNEAFREKDSIPLRDDVAEEVWNLWLELEEMHACFLPYRVDMVSGARTHAQLMLFRDAVRKGALQVLFNSCSTDTALAGNDSAKE